MMGRGLILAARRRARTGRAQADFLRAREGATAVEFALLALPFLAILSATLEVAIGSWAQEMLQQAVSDAGRQIYTGPASRRIRSAPAAARTSSMPSGRSSARRTASRETPSSPAPT